MERGPWPRRWPRSGLASTRFARARGNLAGTLFGLGHAGREWRTDPFDAAPRLAGVADAIELAREEGSRLRDGRRTQTVTWRQLDDALAGLAATVREALMGGAEIA